MNASACRSPAKVRRGCFTIAMAKRVKARVFSTEVARFWAVFEAPRIACRGCYEGVWRAKRRFCAQLRDAAPFRRRDLCPRDLGEDRHKLARAVFHGKRGELRQRYREGQEDQLGALGLVVNIIILWNTLYIEAALQTTSSGC